MAFGRHPDRTILVRLGYSRPFSDVAGRSEVRISNRAEDRQALVDRLKTAGCDVKTDKKTGWLSEGDFDIAIQPPDSCPGDLGISEGAPMGLPATQSESPATAPRKAIKQRQQSGRNSTNIQAGGGINIGGDRGKHGRK
jgi:hypothetical protein